MDLSSNRAPTGELELVQIDCRRAAANSRETRPLSECALPLEQTFEKWYKKAPRDALNQTDLAGKAPASVIPEICRYAVGELTDGDLNTLRSRLGIGR
jgi:hypothetical protein